MLTPKIAKTISLHQSSSVAGHAAAETYYSAKSRNMGRTETMHIIWSNTDTKGIFEVCWPSVSPHAGKPFTIGASFQTDPLEYALSLTRNVYLTVLLDWRGFGINPSNTVLSKRSRKIDLSFQIICSMKVRHPLSTSYFVEIP